MNKCAAVGCTEMIVRTRLMCKTHWFQVPKILRDQIWSTYKARNWEKWSEVTEEAVRFVKNANNE